jgi:hypothetical protein
MTSLKPFRARLSSSFRFVVTFIGACWAIWAAVFITNARAEMQTVTAEGEHRLGDRETKEDGIRLATEQAKRQALDHVASYLESVTIVKDLDVTQDEIRSYTAGFVLILAQQSWLRLEGQTVIVRVKLTAQVDTNEVVQALEAMKQHEDARHELLALRKEIDELHQELNAVNQTLQAAPTPEQARESILQRNELLSRAQSNALLAQAWINWTALVSPPAFPYGYAWDGGLPYVQALIAAATQLNPDNAHLSAMRRAVATQPPVPRTAPAPPVPHTVPVLPRMPTYQVVPRPTTNGQALGAPSAANTADSHPNARRLEHLQPRNHQPSSPLSTPSSPAQEYVLPPVRTETLYTWPQRNPRTSSQTNAQAGGSRSVQGPSSNRIGTER